MLERLKQAISENDNQEPPDLSNWWALISGLEKLVPGTMLFPKWKGYVKKAARIHFFREVCSNPEIESTKDVGSGALWEIHCWLNDEEDGIEHCQQVTDWYAENAQEIYDYVPVVKKAKLESDKARRARKKAPQDIEPPF